MTSVFTIAKQNVTAREVAERYGLKVSRHGKACCPFHYDKSPSMKLDERYYCFGCQATGDAVDLAAKLLGLAPRDAALQICKDFGLAAGKESPVRPREMLPQDNTPISEVLRCADILLDYLWLLKGWEEEYAPQDRDAEWHPRFVEALREKSTIEFMLDELFDCCEDQQLGWLNVYEGG